MIKGDTTIRAMKFSMAQCATWLLSKDWNLDTNGSSINMTTFHATLFNCATMTLVIYII
jgi:hypothetical protein